MAAKVQQPTQSQSIVLLNVNGIRSSLVELKEFIYSFNPAIICINETHLKPDKSFKFHRYQIFRKDRAIEKKGGLLILVRNGIRSQIQPVQVFPGGVLETLCVRVFFLGKFCNVLLIYNPCCTVSAGEFHHYFAACDPNSIICGDFNAHHAMWEPSKLPSSQNSTGHSLFHEFSSNPAVQLLTPPDMATRVDPRTGLTSTIDLFFGIGSLTKYNSIHLGPDVDSDHTPVVLNYRASSESLRSKCRPR